jgi:anaerobic magnesium-protoporphyrin IX monomethyl ester cyclase
MNILLIDPSVGTGDGLNTGLGWLASSVEQVGHGVRVLDFVNREQRNFEDTCSIFKNNILRLKPDIVGFCLHSITLNISIKLIIELKKYYKGFVIVGGPQMAFEHKDIFNKISRLDYAVVGEAEDTLPELLNTLDDKKTDFNKIDGLIWKKGDEVIENNLRKPRGDIDTLTYPNYRKHFGLLKMKAHYSLMTSRGCPYKCSFCNSHMSGKKWRTRSLSGVIDELKAAIDNYEVKEFMVQEPVFNLKPERVIEFCDLLINNKINMPWFIPSGVRADRLTLDSIEAMKKAGCTELKIGVETLVPEVFPSVNKGMPLEKLLNVCHLIKKSSFSLRGSFIIGLPGDTYKNAMKNYKLSQKLGFETTDWSLLIPYPGTQIYDWVQKNGRVFYDYCTADQGAFQITNIKELKLAFDTLDFPAHERIKAFVKISVKSCNYIFDRNAKKSTIVFDLLKQILLHDPLNIIYHFKKIVFRMRLQKSRGATKSDRYFFEELKPF